MTLEVLWARDWALAFGSTAVGTAVVLAVYFAGLAVGAGLAGRLRPRRSLALYGAVEAGVAVSVLGYLALRPALPALSALLANMTSPALLNPARVLLALAVLGLPTTLLGATLPVATSALTGEGSTGGRLYVWNTAGGALGALGGGLWAIHALGIRGTFCAAIALDLTVAAVALGLARTGPVAVPVRRDVAHEGDATLAVLLAAAAGFAGLADEVLWTRGLAGVLSNSVYSITIVLAATLAGITIGADLGVRTGSSSQRARVMTGFAALAFATLVSLVVLSLLPEASTRLVRGLRASGPGGGLAVEAILAGLVVLVPSMCLGALFPATLALAGPVAPGQAMGHVLAANTAGGIAGALAGGFIVLPRLGLGGGLLVTSAIALAAAALAAEGALRRVALAVAVVLAIAMPVLPRFHLAWAGRYGAERLLFYRDGPAATVMVTADAAGGKRLRVNGQYSLGGSDGLLLERREAHLPLLLHPAPTRMLALGVGTGDTLGAALAHPDVQVVGVELIAEVLEAATLFRLENSDALSNPRARLVVDDARSYLLGTRDAYDVILSDLFLPWTAGSSSLYSRDFYELGLGHLRPHGLYCQWLPLHQLAAGDLETIVSTFTRVFPEVQLWVAYHRSTTPLAALIGSREPVHVDANALSTRWADPQLKSALAGVGLYAATDLATLYVTDGRHLRAVTAGVAPITDDRPRLEFSAPAAYFHQEGLGRASLAWVGARLDPDPAPVTVDPPLRFAPRAALLAAQLALIAGDRAAELNAYLQAFALAPEVRGTRAALSAIARERLAAGDRRSAERIAETLGGTTEGDVLASLLGASRR